MQERRKKVLNLKCATIAVPGFIVEHSLDGRTRFAPLTA